MPSTIAPPPQSAESAPSLRIDGNVDPSTGNIDAPADVHIRGNIVDAFHVRSAGHAHVAGVIEAAVVQVGGNLDAIGGISGKERGQVRAVGSIRARYVANASVEAGVDVILQTELSSSRLACHGNLRIENGAIVGGHTTVLGSASCVSVGSPAGTATLVEIGVFESLRRLASTSLPQMERLRKQRDQIRANLAPLMKNQKHLTSQQKEQVTEMLFEADTLDSEIDALRNPLREGWNAWIEKPESALHVAELLHAGVTVRFPGVQAVIDTAMRGPLKLVVRTSGREKYVSLIEGSKEAGFPLPSKPWSDPAMENLAREMEPGK